MKIHGAKLSLRDKHGSISVISAVYLAALFMTMTLLLDGASIFLTKRNMQAAIDIAALSGARVLGDEAVSDTEIESTIEAAFIHNLSVSSEVVTCEPTAPDFDRDAGNVSVSATCWYTPMLGGTIAPNDIKVKVRSKSLISHRKLDVAMVLDVSGTMNSAGKLDALKTASKLAARTLIEGGKPGDNRVSYVAYSHAVNVLQYGPYAWGDTDTIEPLPTGAAPFYCVSERVGDGAWDDRPPGPDAYFPFASSICPKNGLFTLSSNLADFSAAVDSLTAWGRTAGHVGVAWAWYLLSPRWADVWPADETPRAYDDENALKVVILMSDGIFNNERHAPYGNASTQAIKLCGKMRSAGIRIFAVAFDAPPAGQDTLKQCAGDEDDYFEASSNAELIAAYQDIAESLVVLRITE